MHLKRRSLQRQLWGLPVSNPWRIYAVTGDDDIQVHKFGFIVSRGRDDELDASVNGATVKFFVNRGDARRECDRLRAIDEIWSLEKDLLKTIEQEEERGRPLVHEEDYLRDRIAEAKKSLEEMTLRTLREELPPPSAGAMMRTKRTTKT
jgi:hypothetical protein